MTDTKALLKRVRKIEIKTRGLSTQVFSGEYHSAFKGRGMAFSEVREYQPGDEIRTIDWNVTARFNKPYIKVFEEEREMTVMLIVDVSGSENFGSQEKTKKEQIIEICAVLAFSAINNNDKVGVLFFSDQVEKFIPPKKGKSHILMIIRELLEFTPQSKGTNIREALNYFNRVVKKKCTAFIISDFMDNAFEDALKMTNNKHDLVALNIYDQLEDELPNVGLIQLRDAETGEQRWINTSDSEVRVGYKKEVLKRKKLLEQSFRKSGIDVANISAHKSYVGPLMNLFKRREHSR
ncbi:DUF58 domain-containing protein [Vicingaceae bacterium]|nr:DUF58 domain-containing protein [Vicingaceae bacterium]